MRRRTIARSPWRSVLESKGDSVAGILRRLEHAALRRYPTLTWRLWHLKNRLQHGLEFEVEFIQHLDSFVKRPRRTALDVGANFGVYTRVLCQQFQTVHAVEPLPQLAGPLEDAGPRNCVVHRLALGEAHGEIEICVPHSAAKGAIYAFASAKADRFESGAREEFESIERIRVKLAPLDDEFAAVGDLDFIKIDVEGSEMNVLGGARRTLAEQQPIVLVEAEKECGETGLKIFEFLEGFGYTPHYYRGRKLVETDRGILDEMADHLRANQSRPDYPRYRDENYVYNFIFCPREQVIR